MNDPALGRKLSDILGRGRDSLAAARIIFEQGLYADAVSRAYYAAFHAIVALLTAHGSEVSSHAAVKTAFHRDYVRTGILGKELGRMFERLFDDRQLGDYSYDSDWTVGRVTDNLEAAENLLTKIEDYLRAHGHLPP
jgi:uncharacterized protein (UPF0332 family)